jgi:hypothetical protein
MSAALVGVIILMIIVMVLVAIRDEQARRGGGFMVSRRCHREAERRLERLIIESANRRAVERARDRLDRGT